MYFFHYMIFNLQVYTNKFLIFPIKISILKEISTLNQRINPMKKLITTLGLLAVSGLAFAADPLDGSVWRTIDDKTKQPKAIVKFTESNGVLTGSIQQVLTPGQENACTKCEGPYKNKSLKNLKVVPKMKSVGKNTYEGQIFDPNSGKTYSLKATLNGKNLEMRGYLGVSLLGRTQIWQRAN